MNNNIEDLLKSKTKEELIDIFKDIFNEFKELEDIVMFKYSILEEEDEIKKIKKFLSSLSRKYGIGRRFVSWRECDNYTYEVCSVIDNVKDYYIKTEKPLVLVEASIEIIEKMISAVEYMDDSNGGVTDVVYEALALLNDCCSDSDKFSKKDKTKIFNKLFNICDASTFDGFDDWRLGIIENCICFCDDQKLRTKFDSKLNEMIDTYSDDYHGNYCIEKILGIKLSLISLYGTQDKEIEFIENNIGYSSFRELLINKCIENNDFKRVLKLSQDGEIHDKQYLGLVYKWMKYRYEAYKHLNMITEQKALARKLLLNGNIDYYHELKEIFSDTWDTYYADLKKQFKDENLISLNIYPEILIKENDLDELLKYVKLDIRRIEHYDNILINDYRDKVDEIYISLINNTSKISSNRSQYRNVCRIIKKYKKLFNYDNVDAIINNLKATYKKRPAFIDELNKIGG